MLRNLTNLNNVCLRVQLSDYITGRNATRLMVDKLIDYRNWFRELYAVKLTNNVTQCFPTDMCLLRFLEGHYDEDYDVESIAFFLPDLKLMLTQVFPGKYTADGSVRSSSMQVKWDTTRRSEPSDDRFWKVDYVDLVRREHFHAYGMLLERVRYVEGASFNSEYVYIHWNHDARLGNFTSFYLNGAIEGPRFIPLAHNQLYEKLIPFVDVEDHDQVTGFYKVFQLKEDLVYESFYTNHSNMGEECTCCIDWLFTHYKIASRAMYCDLHPE